MKNDCKCRRRTLPVSRPFSRPAIFVAGSLLLSAHSAFAQTLTVNSGSATVSGTGTTVSGSGITFGGGAGNATTNYVTGEATGEDQSGPSTLNLESGGSIQNITADLGGIANISGGSVGTAQSGHFGTIDISGGTVQTAGTGNQSGSLLISGGTVQNANSGSGASSIFNSLTISGGIVGGVRFGYAGVNITGGTIGLVANNSSYGSVNVSGGDIQEIDAPSGVTMTGGTAQVVNGGSFGDSSSNSSFTGGTIQTLNLLGGGSNMVSGGTITSLNDKGVNSNIEISGGSFQFITNSDETNTINITGTDLKRPAFQTLPSIRVSFT